jgi:hypothetical protein
MKMGNNTHKKNKRELKWKQYQVVDDDFVVVVVVGARSNKMRTLFAICTKINSEKVIFSRNLACKEEICVLLKIFSARNVCLQFIYFFGRDWKMKSVRFVSHINSKKSINIFCMNSNRIMVWVTCAGRHMNASMQRIGSCNCLMLK